MLLHHYYYYYQVIITYHGIIMVKMESLLPIISLALAPAPEDGESCAGLRGA